MLDNGKFGLHPAMIIKPSCHGGVDMDHPFTQEMAVSTLLLPAIYMQLLFSKSAKEEMAVSILLLPAI